MVDRLKSLAVLGSADADRAPANLCQIEGMQRLATLKHDEVGDIDDVVDALHSTVARRSTSQAGLGPTRTPRITRAE